MTSESKKVEKLFDNLVEEPRHGFPPVKGELKATNKHGVYIIRDGVNVLYVGRTLRGKTGIYQRLKNHLYGSSSFTKNYLNGKGSILREKGYTYQYVVVIEPRMRALLESLSIGKLCPKHVGLGE